MWQKNKIKQGLLLIIALSLFSSIFLYTLARPFPAGTDGVMYFLNVDYILDTGKIPTPYQKINDLDHYYYASPHPLNSTLLSLLKLITNQELAYFIARFYLLFLLILLGLSTFLVANLYNRRAGYFAILLMGGGSLGMNRFVNGFTIANLLAFIQINFLIYFIYKYLKSAQKKYLWLCVLFTLALFYTHSHLSFPFFLLTAGLTSIIAIIWDIPYKNKIFSFLKTKWRIFLFIVSAGILFGLLYKFYGQAILEEGKNAFLKPPSPQERFRIGIPISQYPNYIGKFIVFFGLLGILIVLKNFKRYLTYFRSFPLIWVAAGLLLPFSYHLGFYFYHERFLFLTIPFFSILGGIALDFIISKSFRTKAIKPIFITIFCTVVIITGSLSNKRMSDRSNFVNHNHIEGLSKLKEITNQSEIIYSNSSVISITAHDISLSFRNIKNIDSNLSPTFENNPDAYAFYYPNDKKSIEFFRNKNVQYFLIQKPDLYGNLYLQPIEKRFENSSHYFEIYKNRYISIYQLD